MTGLSLTIVPERLAICRLSPGAPHPDWAAGSLVSFTRTADELSVVCAASAVPPGVRAEADWVAFRVAGILAFSLTGILAGLSGALATAGIPCFALSTFDTDYLLVRAAHLTRASAALRAAGYSVAPPG